MLSPLKWLLFVATALSLIACSAHINAWPDRFAGAAITSSTDGAAFAALVRRDIATRIQTVDANTPYRIHIVHERQRTLPVAFDDNGDAVAYLLQLQVQAAVFVDEQQLGDTVTAVAEQRIVTTPQALTAAVNEATVAAAIAALREQLVTTLAYRLAALTQ